MSAAAFMVDQSDLLPMMMATTAFCLVGFVFINRHNYTAHMGLIRETPHAIDPADVAVADLARVHVSCFKSAGNGNVGKFQLPSVLVNCPVAALDANIFQITG